MYGKLEEPDGLAGLAKLRSGGMKLSDQVLAAEKAGSWSEALGLHEQVGACLSPDQHFCCRPWQGGSQPAQLQAMLGNIAAALLDEHSTLCCCFGTPGGIQATMPVLIGSQDVQMQLLRRVGTAGRGEHRAGSGGCSGTSRPELGPQGLPALPAADGPPAGHADPGRRLRSISCRRAPEPLSAMDHRTSGFACAHSLACRTSAHDSGVN